MCELSRAAARGFTLVELVMVIMIIGILAAVVGPRFFDRSVFDERMFREESLSAVRYAQKLALASGCKTQISLDASGYRVRRAASCSSGNYTADVSGPDGQTPFASAQVPANISVNATGFPLAFDSLGRPSSAARVVIGSQSFTVTADTGLIQ